MSCELFLTTSNLSACSWSWSKFVRDKFPEKLSCRDPPEPEPSLPIRGCRGCPGAPHFLKNNQINLVDEDNWLGIVFVYNTFYVYHMFPLTFWNFFLLQIPGNPWQRDCCQFWVEWSKIWHYLPSVFWNFKCLIWWQSKSSPNSKIVILTISVLGGISGKCPNIVCDPGPEQILIPDRIQRLLPTADWAQISYGSLSVQYPVSPLLSLCTFVVQKI